MNSNGRRPALNIGVIGYGYWGPNIVRNFHTHEGSEVVLVCDKSTKCQERLHKAHPSIAFTMDAHSDSSGILFALPDE